MTAGISWNANSYNVAGGSKVYVPVSPSNVIYSQFDHISGIAAHANQNSISVSKIQILNSMIDNLVKLRNQPKMTSGSLELSDKQVDALIKNYQNEIKTAVNNAKAAGGYGLAGAMPQVAALFSIDV